jgi:hypothetical protein
MLLRWLEQIREFCLLLQQSDCGSALHCADLLTLQANSAEIVRGANTHAPQRYQSFYSFSDVLLCLLRVQNYLPTKATKIPYRVDISCPMPLPCVQAHPQLHSRQLG